MDGGFRVDKNEMLKYEENIIMDKEYMSNRDPQPDPHFQAKLTDTDGTV